MGQVGGGERRGKGGGRFFLNGWEDRRNCKVGIQRQREESRSMRIRRLSETPRCR